jgi:GMP synthase-like glutamine amidotransferase
MIERIPEGYSRMAESSETPIEAMKRSEKRIVYGVQFHPEIHDDHHPAGKVILSNFAKIVNR